MLRFVLPAILPALAACSDSPLPGNDLGTYAVSGTPGTNTCGLGAPNPWQFDVMLSEQNGTLYWSWLDGSPLLSGALGGSTASLATTSTLNADSTDAGLGPCTLDRADQLELALGAGSPPGTFTGTISVSYAPASGATCTDQLTSSGGTFTALPCSVAYTVTGTHK